MLRRSITPERSRPGKVIDSAGRSYISLAMTAVRFREDPSRITLLSRFDVEFN
jgi:hypothetical protein